MPHGCCFLITSSTHTRCVNRVHISRNVPVNRGTRKFKDTCNRSKAGLVLREAAVCAAEGH